MKKIGIASAVLTLGLTAACGGGPASSSEDGVLKFGAVLAHTTLHPDRLPLAQMSSYVRPLYDSLTFLGSDESVQPLLAPEREPDEDDDGPDQHMTLRPDLSL